MNYTDNRMYILDKDGAIELAKAMINGDKTVYYHYGEWKPLSRLSFDEILSCKFPMKILNENFVNIGKHMLEHWLKNYQVYFKKDNQYIKFSGKHESYLIDYDDNYYLKLMGDDKYEMQESLLSY